MKIEYKKDLKDVFKLDDKQVYIIDSNIYTIYKQLFQSIKNKSRIFIYEANEHTKNFDSLQKIYSFLHTNSVNRSNIIYGIGGGITTDIAAFSASTYKRGCRLILIPTTLLGMVDASIGGKTGINYNNIKNGVGSFYIAEKVIINTKFLESLSETEYKNGFVEIVKMSFLPQSDLLSSLAEQQSIEAIIKEAIRTKLELTHIDLHDKSSRRLLNLGHTFGHILESVSNYDISHGTSVAIGIRAAAKLSFQKGFVTREVLEVIERRLDKYALPTSFNSKYLPEILRIGKSILKQDKKADDKYNLVLFNGIQNLTIYKTDEDLEVINVLREFADV